MIRNYFLTAWRNLVKNKLNASINVIGLSVAFACCMLLFLMVHQEFSFDNFHRNKNQLFIVYSVGHAPEGDRKSTTMSYPASPAFRADVPGIIRSSAYMWGGKGIRYQNKEVDQSITFVDADFFSMFSFPIVQGDQKNPLYSTSNVVINQSTATAMFGKEDPVGKIVKVKISGEWKDLMVSAVVQDAPENSSIQYSILARIEIRNDYAGLKDNWNNQNHPVFVQTAPQVTQQQVEKNLRLLVKKYNLADEEAMKSKGYRRDSNGDMFAYKLLPFADLHFNEELGINNVTTSKTYLYTLILITLVVMVIACFNFINLNVARAFTRAKEVGVRKTIGAGKKQIFFQLLTESFLLCIVAFVIALVAALAVLQPFNNLFTQKLRMNLLLQPAVAASIAAGMLVVSLMAGGYPAWFVSRFNPVEVLKGKVSIKQSSLLRNGLITFQFIMASLLICSTFIIYGQFQHLRTAPLGFEQESMISIPVKKAENTRRYVRELRTQLASQPQVVSVTGSSINIGIGEDKSQSAWEMGFTYKGKDIETGILGVDYDYLQTLNIKPIAGRDFSRDYPADTSTEVNNVLVTESMAKQLSSNIQDVVGLALYSDTAAPKWNIVGVIPDFHLYSMHEKLRPLTLLMSNDQALAYILVKVKTRNPLQAMNLVKDAYKKIEPDNTISPSYVNENTLRWYKKEQRLSNIFCSAAAIAILLSCLGLFAIVSLVMEQRRKEIGVRKVLGASIPEIAGLLSKDFLRLVVLAFAIATPVAWYFLNQWLQNFTYRIHIGWWLFPAAGLLTLLIAVATISVQTIKASLANPVKSLRTE